VVPEVLGHLDARLSRVADVIGIATELALTDAERTGSAWSPAPEGAGEVWRAVGESGGSYRVSNRGRVQTRAGHVLAVNGGRVVLGLPGGQVWRRVEDLVAAAFGGGVQR
jgi:hypothetical protein